jgi:hypothetical protein
MGASDLDSSLLGDAGGFAEACKPADLVYFVLNVGDGDTQLLLLPEHAPGQRRCVIVDCIDAPKLFALIDELIGAGLLGQTKPLLTLVVATHPHHDHISGMGKLLRRLGDGHLQELWEPGYYHSAPAYHEMMRELEDGEILHMQPSAGTTRYLGKVKITVLAPGISLRSRFDSYGIDPNDASLALKIEFPAINTYEDRAGDRSYRRLRSTQTLILGADAQTLSWGQVLVDFPQLGPEKSAVTAALRRARGTEPLRAQVLKIPHHGSKHGVNLELAEKIKPQVSIVSSVREGGRYHFPHEVTLAALREALNPISSKPGETHSSDAKLNILYTGSDLVDDGDGSRSPLGSVGLLIGVGGRREIWRFGDGPGQKIALAKGRPLLASIRKRKTPVPATGKRMRRFTI